MRICFFLLCGLVLGAAAAGQAVRLSYPATPGTQVAYRYEVTVTGALTPPKDAPAAELDLLARARVIEAITGVTRGQAILRMAITQGKLTGTSAGETVNETVPDSTVRYRRTPLGLMSDLTADVPADDTLLPGLDHLWQLFVRFGHHLPLSAKDLRLGDSWHTEQEIAGQDGRRMTLITDSTLVGSKVVDGTSYLQIASRYRADTPDARDAAAKGTTLVVDCHLTGTAQLLFDAKAGAVFRSTFAMDMTSAAAYRTPGAADTPAGRGLFQVRGTAKRE